MDHVREEDGVRDTGAGREVAGREVAGREVAGHAGAGHAGDEHAGAGHAGAGHAGAEHEAAGHEQAGREAAGHEQAGREAARHGGAGREAARHGGAEHAAAGLAGAGPAGADGLLGVELRHLRGFLAVAGELSFTHAADRLRVGQPALTRTVRALEESLGTRLLDRTTRRVALTEAGQRLRDGLGPLLGRLDATLRTAAGTEPPLLRLGFTSLLPEACATLNAAFEAATGAGVRLVRRDAPLAGLKSGACDVAVVRGDIAPGSPVRSHVLLHEPRVAVVARGAAELAGRRVVDWSELAELPLVVNTVTGTTRPDLWPEHRRPRLACTADNFDEWLEAVAAGHGVGVAPEPVARRHSHPALRYVRLKNAPPVAVRLAVPARDAHPLAERYLAQFIEASSG